MTLVDFPKNPPRGLLGIYLTFQTLAMIFQVLVLMNATICVMFGPGLALRGPKDGMEIAVSGLEEEKNTTFFFFRAGIVCFIIALCMWNWLAFPIEISVTMTILCIAFFIIVFKYNNSIQKRFASPMSQEDIFGDEFEENKEDHYSNHYKDYIIDVTPEVPEKSGQQFIERSVPQILPPVAREQLRSSTRAAAKSSATSSVGPIPVTHHPGKRERLRKHLNG